MTQSDVPQVHSTHATRGPVHINTSTHSTRRTTSELPPPYSSLHESTNIESSEDALPDYESHDEADLLEGYGWEDKTTRMAFIQKVLAIKLLQLLGMTAVMSVFLANDWPIVRFLDGPNNNLVHVTLISLFSYLLVFVLMIMCERTRRENPFKFIFVVAYPLSLSLFLIFWTIYWRLLAAVLLACVYYCVVLFALLLYSIFAFQSKLKFVTKYGIMIAIIVQIIMYAFTVPFIDINAVHVLYPTVILILEYIYVMQNIREMTYPDYWHSITPADFVDGALNLHLDYYNIFHNLVLPKIKKGARSFIETLKNVDEALDV